MLARYGLQVLREEAPMLRLIASEQARPPAVLERARDVGLSVLRHELCDWMTDIASEVDPEVVATMAAVAIDALIARQVCSTLLAPAAGEHPGHGGGVDEDTFVDEWVAMVGARLDRLARAESLPVRWNRPQ